MNFQINKYLEEKLTVSPDFITILVIGVCLILFIYAYKSGKLRDITPALMVSAGIIGTFWGTFIALAHFQTGAHAGSETGIDHGALVESIPKVLEGMKTAFVTSLIGLFSAFTSKVIFHILPRPEPEPLEIEENTLNLLRDIKKGIAGDGEDSLSSQIKTLESVNQEGFKQLDKRLDGLSEAIRESLVDNIKELIQKIDSVIGEQLESMLKRIEDMLTKEFGKTLREFNETTVAIKKWQEDHRQHVEELTEAFKRAAQGIGEIRSDCEKIPEALDKLRELMGELDVRMRAFADMKKSAEESFPVIKQHLDAIGEDMRSSAQEINHTAANLKQTAESTSNEVKSAVDEAVRDIRQKLEAHQNDIKGMTMAVQKEAKDCIDLASAAASDMSSKHLAAMRDITEKWGQNMVGIAEKMKDVIEK